MAGRAPTRVGIGARQQVPVLQAPGGAGPGSYREAAGRAMPAVVNILTSKALRDAHPLLKDPFFRRFFGDKMPPQEQMASLGSGVIVSSDGYILTNFHVIDGADEIEVGLADGRKAAATIVGTDPETDLAVIRIKADKLPVIVLGDPDEARVGDVVLAIGNPFGVGQTVTLGIISALGRNNLHINHFENFIQTDAAINFGNSGGALVDTQRQPAGHQLGDLFADRRLGRHRLRDSRHDRQDVLDSIIKHGQVVRGWIGVESQDITPELADSFGLGRDAAPSSPASCAAARPTAPACARATSCSPSTASKSSNTNDMMNLIADLSPGGKAQHDRHAQEPRNHRRRDRRPPSAPDSPEPL
jgi:serine protease DegQ